MPRYVRNFWIELDVDGRSTKVATGPRTKDGGFQLTVKMRDDGGILNACEIMGTVDESGELCLTVYDECDVIVQQLYTER